MESENCLREFVLLFGSMAKGSEERASVVHQAWSAANQLAPNKPLTKEHVYRFLHAAHRRAELAVLKNYLELAVNRPNDFVRRFKLKRIPEEKLPVFVSVNSRRMIRFAKDENAAAQPGRITIVQLLPGYTVIPLGGPLGYRT